MVQAINRLGGAGDSDVFGAVSDASRRITTITPERRMVVLISAGKPVASQDKRAASLAAARNSGVMFYPVAVGEEADRDYLGELALSTGGRMLTLPTRTHCAPYSTTSLPQSRGSTPWSWTCRWPRTAPRRGVWT